MLMFGPNRTEEKMKEECQTDAVGQVGELDGCVFKRLTNE